MKALVVVPTYDEAANIVDFLEAVRSAVPEVDVLVVDDASPDGTADLATAAGKRLGQVSVLRRPRKDGLGNAYRQAFRHRPGRRATRCWSPSMPTASTIRR